MMYSGLNLYPSGSGHVYVMHLQHRDKRACKRDHPTWIGSWTLIGIRTGEAIYRYPANRDWFMFYPAAWMNNIGPSHCMHHNACHPGMQSTRLSFGRVLSARCDVGIFINMVDGNIRSDFCSRNDHIQTVITATPLNQRQDAILEHITSWKNVAFAPCRVGAGRLPSFKCSRLRRQPVRNYRKKVLIGFIRQVC